MSTTYMQSVTLQVHPHRVGPVKGRHPWIFSRAFISIPDGLTPGTPIRVEDTSGAFLCSGYFGSYAQIAVRVWSYDEEMTPSPSFFKEKVESALRLRMRYIDQLDTDSYRLINGEHDGLPGLIVDRYNDYLSLQFHTKGIELYQKDILDALIGILKPKGVYERSDVAARRVEDAPLRKQLLYGDVPDRVCIRENGLLFYVDIKEGQKTGFFLDQRDKRLATEKYAKGQRVLNCFSYTGGFSVYALAAGASHVTSVDVSASAMELLQENMKLNKLPLDKCDFVVQDVKKYLTQQNQEGNTFDFVILDPPAFIKNRRKKNEGISGYKKINEMGMRALSKEGILLSCSCSHHLSSEDFRYILSESGAKTETSLQFLEQYGHGLDHPELVPFTEGNYLKSYFMRVI